MAGPWRPKHSTPAPPWPRSRLWRRVEPRAARREGERAVAIYFDYNATTPLDPAVREAMMPFLDGVWGNPSSVHQIGRAARAALDEARYRLSGLWKCRPSEVVFTSGGTEANNLAVLGAARRLRAQGRGRHLLTSAVEHPAVLHAHRQLQRLEGFEVTELPVDAAGRVDPQSVAAALRPDTLLVSVMAANNEVGTLQPVAEIGALCRERGVCFHTDAVQALGKRSFEDIHQFQADLVAVCAHKFHGPKGAGALFIRSPLQPESVVVGGGHENERRAGT
ncbi:MAG: cysteine desulfurase, partial [Verrucomicrobiae bacterium]|nr:cysteine desulfurase [Verrucomicrobiae bacterium]